MVVPLWLWSAAAVAAPVVEPTPAAATDEDPAKSRPILVDPSGLDELAFADELALRLPDRQLVDVDAPRPKGELIYTAVRREGERLQLTIVLPGGDAYDQAVDDVPGQSARVAAGGLVTLLDAIEAGRLAPSRTQVEIPEPAAPEPEPEPEPPPPEPEPEPPPPEPEPLPPEPEPAPPEPPRWQLGPRLAPGLVLGVAPRTDAPVLAAAGGAIGLSARHVRGGLIDAGLRITGRTSDGTAVVRARVAVGGGWAFRWQSFELPLVGAATIEPWWPRHGGDATGLRTGSAAVDRQPLLGALVAASPGFLLRGQRPNAPMIRLGARIEGAGSFVPDGGARTVEIGIDGADGRDATLRLGGLELSLALDVAIWFAVPRP